MKLFQQNDLSRAAPIFEPVSGATEEERLAAVLDRFDLALSAGGAARLRGSGPLARVFRVETGSGTWILKERDLSRRPELVREVETGERMAGTRVPVAEPRRARDGAPTVVDAKSVWAVFRFVNGRYFRGGREQIAAAAEVFGRLVGSTSASAPADGAKLDEVGDLVVEAARELEDEPARALCAAHAGKIAKEARAAAAVRGAMEASVALVHLDFHPLNLLMDGPRVACVLDFEDVVPYPVGVALGFAAFKLVRQALVAVDEGSRLAVAPDLVDTWLAAWHASSGAFRATPVDLGAGARYRVLVLLHLILRSALHDDNPAFLYDLEKQLLSLYEIDFIFGDTP